jgi:Tfp pilus assembly protein PilE
MNIITPPDFEIYEFYEPSLWENRWVQAAVVLLILAVIAATAYAIIMRRRRRGLTPGQTALRALQAYTNKDFSNKKEVKAAYFAMTAIIKQYLHSQFKLAVLDKTDDELLTFIEEKQFHAPTLEALKKIHHSALVVKFANYDMIKTQAELDIVLARQIIETLDLLVEHQQRNNRTACKQ